MFLSAGLFQLGHGFDNNRVRDPLQISFLILSKLTSIPHEIIRKSSDGYFKACVFFFLLVLED